jgi:hypothetical protein
MASASNGAMASATAPTRFVAIPRVRDPAADHTGTAAYEAAADALLALPNSMSPELHAHTWHDGAMSPPPMIIDREHSVGSGLEDENSLRHQDARRHGGGIPLSVGALSSLDESITITPAMLAKHHLPKIMLGQGAIPIRDVLYELTQMVPGFSRIPPAKARRIVVAALEKPSGGGLAGEVAFDKIGWGKWHAHVKGSSPQDSGIGSYVEDNYSPERNSERSSRPDSAVHLSRGVRKNQSARRHREHHSGGSWTASSLLEEDESGGDRDVDMDMDVLEEAAERMSLDGRDPSQVSSDSDNDADSNSDTDDDTWAAEGIDALRKASLPTPNLLTSRGIAIRTVGGGPGSHTLSQRDWQHRRLSAVHHERAQRGLHSSSVPQRAGRLLSSTPEERAAMALMSLGSM